MSFLVSLLSLGPWNFGRIFLPFLVLPMFLSANPAWNSLHFFSKTCTPAEKSWKARVMLSTDRTSHDVNLQQEVKSAPFRLRLGCLGSENTWDIVAVVVHATFGSSFSLSHRHAVASVPAKGGCACPPQMSRAKRSLSKSGALCLVASCLVTGMRLDMH